VPGSGPRTEVEPPRLRSATPVPGDSVVTLGRLSEQLPQSSVAIIFRLGAAFIVRDAPASTASITRSRKSLEYGFGIVRTPKGRISAVRLAHQRPLGNPFDSTQPENALIVLSQKVTCEGI